MIQGERDQSGSGLIPKYAFERGNIMKGISVITLALCLGACASQPAQTVATDQPAVRSTDQIQPSNDANERSSDRVYLDDFERVPFPARTRGVHVLGTNKG
jgi:hypothetical protein